MHNVDFNAALLVLVVRVVANREHSRVHGFWSGRGGRVLEICDCVVGGRRRDRGVGCGAGNAGGRAGNGAGV